MATREDPSHAQSDALVLGAAAASLSSVGLILIGGHGSASRVPIGGVVLTFVSIALSWAVVHTSFCLRYARLDCATPPGGVDVNEDAPPSYVDFAHLAFTLGITFQVSDTAISSREIRRTALRHALLSFLFGTVILSVTINLVVSLAG